MKTVMSDTVIKGNAQRIWLRRTGRELLMAGILLAVALAQSPLTWEQIKDKFETANPTLRAAQLNINESRAAEVTAYLRPNPDLTLSTDGTQLSRYQGVWRPFAGTQYGPGISYLHERGGKRELRRDSAKESTAIAQTTYTDQERGLLFNLRSAFVGVL